MYEGKVIHYQPQFVNCPNSMRYDQFGLPIIYTVRCGRCNGQAGDADIAASYVCIFYFSFSGSKTSLDRNSNNEHTICAEQSLCITNLLIELTQSPETIQEESCRQQTSCTVLKIGSKARKKLSQNAFEKGLAILTIQRYRYIYMSIKLLELVSLLI